MTVWRFRLHHYGRHHVEAELSAAEDVVLCGMPPTSLMEPTGRYLSFAERQEIALLRAH